ncbi:ATP-binding protein [Kribbella sp. CA-294648]|uniref:ATP-binding protein n=1 Tax=Kribbella sp. CA-294648 TaxID=3239948 RepID=UPI003D8D7AA5
MVEASDDKILTKTIARYGRFDLLCIDELGYMQLDRCGAELLFQVPTEWEEKNSVAIARMSRSLVGERPSPTPGPAPRSSTG